MVRATREIKDTAMIPAMKKAEIMIPSGRSMMLSRSAESSTAVRMPKARRALRCPRDLAEMVTATAPETIITRIPVAYAPAGASAFAVNPIVIRMLTPVYTSTTGRTARLHTGAIP